MASAYNLKDECGVSAFSLALSIAADNPELASKLADLAEQANEAGLFSEALKEGALKGIDGDVKKLSHGYSLKEESAEMKFRAALFGGVFDKTAQGDEALRIIADEILNTGGTLSEGIELYRLIGELDLSSLNEVAKIMTGGDLEAAKNMVDNLHKKLSYYVGSEYSVVSSGSKTKLDGIIKEYKSKIDAAQKKIDAFEKKLGAAKGKVKNLFRWLDNDIEKLKKIKANTIEGKNELSKMADKYGVKDGKDVKVRLEKKLNEIKRAKEDLDKAKKTKVELEAAKEYKDALNGDIKLIEDGGNPFNLMSGDQEWRFIKDFNADPSVRAKKYGQYVLARVLLTGGKDLPKEVIDVIKSGISGGVVNYLDEALTEEWILEEGRTLEELLARAYTNTADIANNGQLRMVYRQRLLELASDGEVAMKDAEYIESLVNTLQFSSAGSGFSDVLKYNYLVRAANNLGLEIPASQGEELWKSIVNLFKKNGKDFGRAIAGDFVKLGNGIELTTRQLLELTAQMLGNTNINKLIAADAITDREILDIAGKYLIGDAKAGGNRLEELINAAKTAPSTDDTRGVVLKAITGHNIPKEAKVGFFDFRRKLKASPDVEARAKFMERLSNANTLEIPNGTITDLTDNLERRISEYKGGFIIVNDSQYKMNKRLVNAVDNFNRTVEKAEDKITIIYPTGGLLGTITSVDGKIIYRTVNSESFNNLVRNIAIRALGQSDIDSKFSKELQEKLLRGDVDALAEYNKLLEEDAKEYFRQMLGLGKESYEEKLPAMLEAATGISFKNYDAITDKVAFWKKIDENFIVGLKTSGSFDQEFVTVADVIKEVDALTPEQMSDKLSKMFDLDVKVNMITEDGKIKQVIRDAYLHYQLSQDPLELLERKGRLLAVLNGGTADTITVAQFKAMLQSGDFSSFKDLFFHNLDLTDEELDKHAKKISDMIFNSLSAQVAMNLVKMGYQLPMVNVRDLVYDFLMDKLNVNGGFARAFLFKNGLGDTLETLRGIVNEAMPSELRFGYEDGYKYDVVHHGSYSLHTKFDLNFGRTGEGGAAHGYGIYVTKEKPGYSTYYANNSKKKKKINYHGMTYDELMDSKNAQYLGDVEYAVAAEFIKWFDSPIVRDSFEDERLAPLTQIFRRVREMTISALEREKEIYSDMVKTNPDDYWAKKEVEIIEKKIECANKFTIEDFGGGEFLQREIKKPVRFEGLLKSELEQKMLDGLGNQYTYRALTDIMDDLEFGFYEYVYSDEAKKTLDYFKEDYDNRPHGFDLTFKAAKERAIRNLRDLYESDIIYSKYATWVKPAGLKKKYEEAVRFINGLEIKDFDIPRFGKEGYFYKIEIPPIKEGFDTPSGRNYLDDRHIVYNRSGFVGEEFVDNLIEKLFEWGDKNGHIFPGSVGDYIKKAIEKKFKTGDIRRVHTAVTEEEVYDVIENLFASDVTASQFFKDIGYEGLRYVGDRDGECFVLYNTDALDILRIYDNRYKTVVWEKPGLDESKYVTTGMVENIDPKTTRHDIYSLINKFIDETGAEAYDESSFRGIVDDLAMGLTYTSDVKAYIHSVKEEWEKLVNDAAEWHKKEYARVRDFCQYLEDHLDEVRLEGQYVEKELNELENFTRPSAFQLKEGEGWGRAQSLEEIISAEDSLLIEDFRNGRTVKEIADAYGLPINIVEKILTPDGFEAYGRFGMGAIDLAGEIAEGTAPHELFHGMFSMVDEGKRVDILSTAKKLYGFDDTEAEEFLADKFSEYFRTGKVSLPKEQKAFMQQIIDFFKEVADWIRGVEKYEGEVTKLFDDMLDLKYAPKKQEDILIRRGSNKELLIDGIPHWGFDDETSLIDVETELAIKDFKNGRTIKEVAKQYGIPIAIADDYLYLFHRGALARTEFATGRGGGDSVYFLLMEFRNEVAEGTTGAHELFHAIFRGYVPEKERTDILEGIKKLYNYDDSTANEMLADLFNDYYRTGKFSLPKKEMINKKSPDAVVESYILRVFKKIKNWLIGIDKYEDQILKLYDDILDLKYANESRGFDSVSMTRDEYVDAKLEKAKRFWGIESVDLKKAEEGFNRHVADYVDAIKEMQDIVKKSSERFSTFGDYVEQVALPHYADLDTAYGRGMYIILSTLNSEELGKIKTVEELKAALKKSGLNRSRKSNVVVRERAAYGADGRRLWGNSAPSDVRFSDRELDERDYLNRMALRDLAKEYGLPIEIMDFYMKEFHPGAWGVTMNFQDGNGKMNPIDAFIALKNQTEHGTVAHELFHAIFYTSVPENEQIIILNEARKLYNLTAEEANEMLADLFSEYYHTGKINLPKSGQETKAIESYILRVFRRLRNRIRNVDKYEVKLRKLYDNILDYKYAGKIDEKVAAERGIKVPNFSSKEEMVNWRKKRFVEKHIIRLELASRLSYDGLSREQLKRMKTDSNRFLLSTSVQARHQVLALMFQEIYKSPNSTFDEIKQAIKDSVLSIGIDDEDEYLQIILKEINDLDESKLSKNVLDELRQVDVSGINNDGTVADNVVTSASKEAPVSKDAATPDYMVRTIERKNDFAQDTYSSLIAMASVKNGERLPSLGSEEEILRGILDKYHNSIAAATKGGKTLSFADAQKLKIQASHALDMFEQDFLFPRYKQFLTPQERSELMGLKYGLAVATDSNGLKTIKDYNDAILERYRHATDNIIMHSGLFSEGGEGAVNMAKEIERRQQELLDQGATMKVVNGQIIVVDIREELFKELQNIPNNILGLENLKAIGRSGLSRMSNEKVYFLLNVVQLAKNMENKTNLIIKTLYKVNPRLARIDFFNSYRLVNGLPKRLQNNLLINSKFLSKFSGTLTFDDAVKKAILSKIKEAFGREGKLEYDQLEKIVADSITENKNLLGNVIKGGDAKKFIKEANLIYIKAFTPYTYLVDVPREVKNSIANILTEQQKGIRKALSLMGEDDKLAEVMDNIAIYGNDGTVKTFRELLDGEPDDINKIIFGSDNEIIMGAEEKVKTPTDGKMSRRARKKIEKENKELAEAVENNYKDGLQAYLTQSDVVSEAERKLLNTTMTAARQLAKKYTSTNKLAETDNALASINEEIIRRFKADILGLGGKISRGGQRRDFGGKIQEGILDRWDDVKARYKVYYSMDLAQLGQARASNPIDVMALNLAKYFKEIESRLGSIDGIKGVTTDITVNRAFGHLGEVVLNVKTMDGLYSLMSGIEGNQILKFFRFSNPKQLSYVKKFVIGGEGKETIGGYRTYVDRLDEGLDRDWFNKTFATNFSQSEYRKIVQALTGFTIINKKWKRIESALNFANSSNYLLRVAVSYPGQILTIANQSIAYFLREKGWEESLGIEDLGTVDSIRRRTGALNGTYNEINWFNGYSTDDLDPTSFYNRYGVPDVDDVYRSKKFYSTDDVETIFSKIDEYGSEGTLWDKINDKLTSFFRNTDAYKDNANNIIDGIFARNFKNIAFVRALQTNQVMRFATAEQFARFMASDAPEAMKKRLMDAVISDSGKHFRNILGLGFSGLDRAVSGGNKIFPAWSSNIMVGIAGLFNFRGAWGQNIARQTNNFFLTALRMGKMGLTKEGRDAIALFLARQPEFVNFAAQLFTDLKNSWKLVRFQDNGHLPDEDDEWSWLDFISYAAENIQFASQRWQGIQSYGTTRILTEWGKSALQSHANPDIYKDTYGVGAFFNAMQKNMGRNWKAPKFVVNAIAQGVTNGIDAFWTYLGNEWRKLSFGTLRYLMNEDETSYGFSAEMPERRTGIPFILTGEANEEGDKAFSYDLANTETRENITNRYEAKKNGDTEAAGIYAMNLWDTAFNSSPLLGTVKGVGRVVNGSSLTGSTIKGRMDDMHFYKATNPFDLAEAGDLIAETEAGMALEKYGYYIPSQSTDVKIFIDTIIGQSDFRPGNGGFNKSFFNFDNSGHMKNLEESNPKDAAMELLLTNMKYKRDADWNYVVDEQGNKIVTDYWKNHMDEIERKIHDEDFLIRSNFNFINDRVEQNNKDPNYMLYKKLIGEGLAGNYLEQKINEHISNYNTLYGLKKTDKLTLSELKNSSYYDEVIPRLKSDKLIINGQSMPFLEALATLDETALMEADIKIVERQLSQHGNQEAIKKFFSVNEKGEVNLTTKYESFLEEQGRLSSYLRAGDLDSFLAETASVTKVFKKDDPYGLMTTTLLGSRVNQINSSNYLSAEQKAKAINVLFKDNAEFIQQHIPEMISELGDKAEAYITQMNDSLYGSSLITDKLITDNEMNNSKSGRSAAKSASDTIKAVIVDLAKAVGDTTKIGVKKYEYNFTPVKFNGSKLLNLIGGKGYSPETPSVVVQRYKPHADFGLAKDINRNVKGPKTQQISNKKQLSKIESSVEKALEAEN